MSRIPFAWKYLEKISFDVLGNVYNIHHMNGQYYTIFKPSHEAIEPVMVFSGNRRNTKSVGIVHVRQEEH